jgi:cytochrome o ubiquinol oxidase subunit 3
MSGAESSAVGAVNRVGPSDPYHMGHHGGDLRQHTAEHAGRDLASKRVIVGYGFWIFLLSDIVMFSAFFASFAVLAGRTAGGPSGAQVFDLTNVAIETALLLFSSFTCGIASIGARAHNALMFYGGMAVTFLLGAGFLYLEMHEFVGLIAQNAGPERSAFLSAFFTVVGCHGLHVTLGLLWLLTMMAQVFAKGFRPDILRRVLCFSLFWHALDIIWVALFTIVYLMGSGQ